MDIEKSLECLKNGGVIIYPSESSYSFGCDAKNKEAIKRVHKIKKEGEDKAFILNVFDLNQVEEFGVLNDVAIKLFDRFKGRALTLIIDRKEGYGDLSKEGIAFRVLNNDVANKLAKDFGAIITTSVNVHGEKPLYDIKSVKEQFGDEVDVILDSGDLDENVKVSTLVDTRSGKVLREGAISKEEIEEFLRK